LVVRSLKQDQSLNKCFAEKAIVQLNCLPLAAYSLKSTKLNCPGERHERLKVQDAQSDRRM
ncbi:hypothetical protein T05_4692, partial [Trichinella murrelli]